jgi:hypothetical protein
MNGQRGNGKIAGDNIMSRSQNGTKLTDGTGEKYGDELGECSPG